MKEGSYETKRRTVVKTLLWRIIGIIWSWIVAYLIIVTIPSQYNTAAIVATLIVIFYQSTRMIMYYVYERTWVNVDWGRCADKEEKYSLKTKIVWTIGIIITILAIFYALIYYPS